MTTAQSASLAECLPEAQVDDKMAVALSDVLAETYRLESKTHAYHWNVDAVAFFAISKLTEEQYDNMFEAADTLAARIQALGYDAPPRRHDGHDLVEVHAKNTLTTQDMMADLAAGHERLCDLLSDLTRLANDQFDIATGDIALDRIAFHKQAAWMLREIATA